MPIQSSSATYDLSTPVGQTRFHLADTDVSPGKVVWSDAEITYALSISQTDPILAASYCLEAAAVDRSKMAYMIRITDLTTDWRQLSVELAARAATLRSLSVGPVSTCGPNQIFSMDSECAGTCGTMDGW